MLGGWVVRPTMWGGALRYQRRVYSYITWSVCGQRVIGQRTWLVVLVKIDVLVNQTVEWHVRKHEEFWWFLVHFPVSAALANCAWFAFDEEGRQIQRQRGRSNCFLWHFIDRNNLSLKTLASFTAHRVHQRVNIIVTAGPASSIQLRSGRNSCKAFTFTILFTTCYRGNRFLLYVRTIAI